jgi:hypothetical protein
MIGEAHDAFVQAGDLMDDDHRRPGSAPEHLAGPAAVGERKTLVVRQHVSIGHG